METATIINLSLALANQALKAAEAANAGDRAEALRLLRQARERFDQAVAGWDAAGG